jgi:hypothetical protein
MHRCTGESPNSNHADSYHPYDCANTLPVDKLQHFAVSSMFTTSGLIILTASVLICRYQMLPSQALCPFLTCHNFRISHRWTEGDASQDLACTPRGSQFLASNRSHCPSPTIQKPAGAATYGSPVFLNSIVFATEWRGGGRK